MIKNKKDMSIIIGMIIVFIGTLLPSIKIANENINFLKDNGPVTIILVAIMFVLFKLEKKQFVFIPSLISISIIIKFVIENETRLKQINELYDCYAEYQYGLIVMIIGNIIILLTLIISIINFKTIKEKTSNLTEKIELIKENLTINKKIKQTKIKKPFISKVKKEKIITQETTKDGEIKFNKIVVKCDNKETKKKKNIINIKGKISDIILKLKLRKISRRKLSISKFDNNYKKYEKQQTKNIVTYKIPVIDIKKWTRNEICCINCGATVSTNSEYCFLCDCKMKISDPKEKIS